jgi:uncharacterized protein (DUF1330 family)
VTVYAIAQLKFTDRRRVIEGQSSSDKDVLMSFPDENAFREWAESADYQRISEDRRAGAETVVVLVQAIRG